MSADPPTCARHPDVTTRVSCSACETPICPDCSVESAVGYKCPDCGTHGGASSPAGGRREGALLSGLGSLRTGGGSRTGPAGAGGSSSSAGRLPAAIGLRATLAGGGAALAGGFVLGFVLAGGTFFLISSGLIGWAVARAVYWATEDRSSPFVQALAFVLAGMAVAVGMVTAPDMMRDPNAIMLLALPAAMYGAWIVVRQR